ncbi:FliH/SctL family protein [Phycicoccus sp. M110.8]|uniref:FliH/SctL family protein n=1 Tax=Phycicoccus sp. M110.8 TaxID=3075433 RepID=UPI0028FD0091|nr:FliH/SctL family protein [Phycicoccus sp. M110.8]MDU0313426.1 FliH/SctL family protein [Phycicoccus sp. M110.8]
MSSSESRRATVLPRVGHGALRPARFLGEQLAAPGAGPAGETGGPARAWDEGHAAGYAAGLLEARREQERWAQAAAAREAAESAARGHSWDAVLAGLREAVTGARAQAAVDDVTATAAALAVEIAEALVGHHLRVGECSALDAVTRALADVPRGSVVTLRVHPDDLPLLPEDTAALCADSTLTLVPDASVGRGGAVADLGDRTVDARLEAALARVREVLAR